MSGDNRSKTNREFSDLLRRDHTLNGGIFFGLDGYIIEIQARAMEVLKRPIPWRSSTSLSGMARSCVGEASTEFRERLPSSAFPSRR